MRYVIISIIILLFLAIKYSSITEPTISAIYFSDTEEVHDGPLYSPVIVRAITNVDFVNSLSFRNFGFGKIPVNNDVFQNVQSLVSMAKMYRLLSTENLDCATKTVKIEIAYLNGIKEQYYYNRSSDNDLYFMKIMKNLITEKDTTHLHFFDFELRYLNSYKIRYVQNTVNAFLSRFFDLTY